jgi:hypothetical protein
MWGSPYCIRRYVVDKHLGGPAGLAIARRELASRGMKLLLDFVPNHVAPDHPWVAEHPEYFVRGNAEDARNDPASYLEVEGNICARGRDPYFPAWPDVLQLNVFQPGLRQAAIETVSSIAAQCDGIRCDMAMLVLNRIFERTWGTRAGRRPRTEYWDEVIPTVRRTNPYFCFIAEAYWDLEWELQQQGFDFCYDKRHYDRLEHGNPESIRLHLCADLAYQDKLLRFLENHDEPRAATAFSQAKQRAAAVATSTLPGARLFHEGQFEGRKVRVPVFLARRPAEPVDKPLQDFYDKLLAAINAPHGCCASEAVGPTIQPFKTWWPGAGLKTMIDVSLWSISATVLLRPACRRHGKDRKGVRGVSSMRFPMRPTTAKGMRWQCRGCMSNWNPGVTTSSSVVASASNDDESGAHSMPAASSESR